MRIEVEQNLLICPVLTDPITPPILVYGHVMPRRRIGHNDHVPEAAYELLTEPE